MNADELRQQYADETKRWLLNHDAEMPYPQWLESLLSDSQKEVERLTKITDDYPDYVKGLQTDLYVLNASNVALRSTYLGVAKESDSLRQSLQEAREAIEWCESHKSLILDAENNPVAIEVKVPVSDFIHGFVDAIKLQRSTEKGEKDETSNEERH
jgi:hypothetical protein